MMDEPSVSENPGTPGLGWVWTLSLLAVPVVYLLSFPPMRIVFDRTPAGPAGWFKVYAMPAVLLYESMPPVQRPLDAYAGWWDEMLR
jgi:hypothetical protein